MFRRRRGERGNGIYPFVPDWMRGHEDEGRDMADIPAGLWCGRLLHDSTPDNVA